MNNIEPARWTRRHLGGLTESAATTAPVVPSWPAPRVLPSDDVWDLWPVQEEDGTPSIVLGLELWMALAAPATGHPEERHGRARLRLLGRGGDGWTDLGHVFADGASLGGREWSGSAVRRPDGTVSVFYTAAGGRGEPRPTFSQRVAEARPRLLTGDGVVTLEKDADHREILRSDGRTYLPADETEGAPGGIRAFRDPGWFRDPADGSEHLLVAASVPWHDGFMGAIALAGARPGGWSLGPPLLVADGVNHEIERPHVVVHDSTYYLFFVTQHHAFHPRGSAPTGLYGFAAPALTGPYRPLNGSGLVIRNPPAHPDQAYAWLVLADLRVVSFLNYRSPGGEDLRDAGMAEARAGFAGTVAPVLRLALDGLTTSINSHDLTDR
ncbi:glycoside hydrolase family 68 protein [Sphaerisporangium flaviroseum]|uniref:glycoside hydrolase family 68 protein n=1 Tax=Sphaerisporangium flaviroseum TaxID=509199 RepID=UPI0031EF21DC